MKIKLNELGLQSIEKPEMVYINGGDFPIPGLSAFKSGYNAGLNFGNTVSNACSIAGAVCEVLECLL